MSLYSILVMNSYVKLCYLLTLQVGAAMHFYVKFCIKKRTMKTVFSMVGTLITDLYDDFNGEHCREEVVKYLQHLSRRHAYRLTHG